MYDRPQLGPAAEVDLLLANSDLRARMGAAAPDKLQREFDPAKITAQWDDLFHNVLSERRR